MWGPSMSSEIRARQPTYVSWWGAASAASAILGVLLGRRWGLLKSTLAHTLIENWERIRAVRVELRVLRIFRFRTPGVRAAPSQCDCSKRLPVSHRSPSQSLSVDARLCIDPRIDGFLV